MDRLGHQRAWDRRLLRWRYAAVLACPLLLAFSWSEPALAQHALCPVPSTLQGGRSPGAARSAQARLRHRDARVSEMAFADLLYENGRRNAAEAIYRRLAQSPSDKRQTARRAKLKLAQAALSRGDLATAGQLVQEATRPGALQVLRTRGRDLQTIIEHRQGVADAEAALDMVETAVAARRLDEAAAALGRLLTKPCPYPVDYRARVQIRMAQVDRAQGDFPAARAAASTALAQAITEKVRERASAVVEEVESAARAAQLRETIIRANALIDADDAAGAVAMLNPLLANPSTPAELEASIRLRLARAYGRMQLYDEASGVLRPLLAPGADEHARERAERLAVGIESAEYEAIAREILAHGAQLHQQRNFDGAARTYQQLLGWNPPPPAGVLESARLGLARARAREGNLAEAREQVALVQANSMSPRLLERATDLLADIDDDVPLNRLTGFVQLGMAYDSNAPTLVSAVRDQEDDVLFPADRRFADGQASIAGRMEYRHRLGAGADHLSISANGLRTLQFDLPQLDRSVLGLRAGPEFTLSDGKIRLRAGGFYKVDWRGKRFRSSEPGVYVGVTRSLGANLSATALYTLAWHNDVREELDGVSHSLEGQLRYVIGPADTLTFRARVKREGGETERVRNSRFLAGPAWRHRWNLGQSFVPFIEASGAAERVIFDGSLFAGEQRRDWKVNLDAALGADVRSDWQVRLNCAFLDISSNESARDRLANLRFGFTVRYTK